MHTDGTDPAAVAGLLLAQRQLHAWLIDVACPLWASRGIDACGGGFVEALDPAGAPLPLARRARVQPRQVYAFAEAARLGWNGDAPGIVRDGIDSFQRRYRRDDGLFRTLAESTGAALDDGVLLYDQAFALLGFAAAAALLEPRDDFVARAVQLRSAIVRHLSADGPGFLSAPGAFAARESNPHMHLFEACLEWATLGADAAWSRWIADLAALAIDRMVLPGSGAIAEHYDSNWRPAQAGAWQRIEPGHQFEWAWLLLRSEPLLGSHRRNAALHLIDVGEGAGVRGGFAINALRGDLSPLDGGSRLWPQAERVKANALAGALTGDVRYWRNALDAAGALRGYLGTRLPGLWFDLRLAGGEFVDGPAPASSFYHVVGAIAALGRAAAGLVESGQRC